jgi:hypothetical protein
MLHSNLDPADLARERTRDMVRTALTERDTRDARSDGRDPRGWLPVHPLLAVSGLASLALALGNGRFVPG